jgi:hypothetical protein
MLQVCQACSALTCCSPLLCHTTAGRAAVLCRAAGGGGVRGCAGRVRRAGQALRVPERKAPWLACLILRPSAGLACGGGRGSILCQRADTLPHLRAGRRRPAAALPRRRRHAGGALRGGARTAAPAQVHQAVHQAAQADQQREHHLHGRPRGRCAPRSSSWQWHGWWQRHRWLVAAVTASLRAAWGAVLVLCAQRCVYGPA